MVVHLAANRTDATVMSIPRDTITTVPACTDPTNGHVYPAEVGVQITSSPQNGGPGCTVATVHALTGIIDHFVMVDFSGVVNMSDAVGGVRVCVDNNVYDTYSGLKLSKGSHTLKGLAALEFVRSRHAFGNGSDIGREAAQHVFLSALIRKLKSANTLTNPVALYALANAATKALTVDNALAGVSKLIALAGQLNDVPANRITFITMPNMPNPVNPNRISPAPGAQAVFQSIVNDQALSAGPPAGAPTTGTTGPPTPPPPPDPTTVQVAVENASRYPGRAAALTAYLTLHSYRATNGGNAPAAATGLTYPPAARAAAEALAAALHLPSTALSATGSGATLVLRIGADWPTGTTFPNTDAPTATANPGPVTPPPGTSTLNAAAPSTCVAVSTQDTTQYGSPIRAHAVNGQKPDSAP
jgi:LCP family protein required for cell wall assembly